MDRAWGGVGGMGEVMGKRMGRVGRRVVWVGGGQWRR